MSNMDPNNSEKNPNPNGSRNAQIPNQIYKGLPLHTGLWTLSKYEDGPVHWLHTAKQVCSPTGNIGRERGQDHHSNIHSPHVPWSSRWVDFLIFWCLKKGSLGTFFFAAFLIRNFLGVVSQFLFVSHLQIEGRYQGHNRHLPARMA